MKSTTSLFIVVILLLLTSVAHPAAQKSAQPRTSACASLTSIVSTPVKYFYTAHQVGSSQQKALGFYGAYQETTSYCTCTDGQHNPSLLRTFADTIFCRQLRLEEQVPAPSK